MTNASGTAFNLGQYNEVHVALTRALPKALATFDPKALIKAVQQGENVEQVLQELFTTLLNGSTKNFGAFLVSSHVVPINRKRNVSEMVKLGNYDWKDEAVNQKNFPHDRKAGKVETEVHLIQFPQDMESDDVVQALDAMGMRPADNAELLSIGIFFSDLQRQGPIVALGSVATVSGDQCVPCLGGDGSDRFLRLGRWDGRWGAYSRFAAVRK